MRLTVADFVLARLRDWGIHRVFGYPGDGINGFLGAFDRADGDPEFIQVRHEEMSAFMACGHAKFTDELGVCIATSGPGAIHLLNGLYDAKLDHQPVLAIVGQQQRLSLGASYQQEVDLQTLFADVAEFVQTCMEPGQVRHLVDRAARIALGRRSVTALVFPHDVQDERAEPSPPRRHGAVFSSAGWTPPRVAPPEDELQRAAELLNDGERVAMLVGQGARDAVPEVIATADVLGAGVAKALLGKDVVSDELPFVTGSIGLLGTRASYELMKDCDTLLIIGSSFPYSEWLPKEGQARGVQIDLDPALIGLRYPVDCHLVGDARETLRALLPLLERKDDRSWRERVEREVEGSWQLAESRARLEGDPINPQLIVHELSQRLPDRCIVTGDSGSSTAWLAQQLRLREGMRCSVSGTLASMGSAVPYALAAKLAHPDRPVIALLGDGAAQMNGLNELITVARYRDHWHEPTFVTCVFNNRDLNMVTWEQRVHAGDPKYPPSQTIPDFPYARFAELCGLSGIRVDDPTAVGPAWERALGARGPVLLEAVVDAEIPPLPPHITVTDAKNLAAALVKGDPEAGAVAEKSFLAKAAEFLPGR